MIYSGLTSEYLNIYWNNYSYANIEHKFEYWLNIVLAWTKANFLLASYLFQYTVRSCPPKIFSFLFVTIYTHTHTHTHTLTVSWIESVTVLYKVFEWNEEEKLVCIHQLYCLNRHLKYMKCLTFADVHLVAVKPSKGLGSAWQTHGSHVPRSAGHLLSHRPSQTAVHQRLQHLHCHTHTHTRH